MSNEMNQNDDLKSPADYGIFPPAPKPEPTKDETREFLREQILRAVASYRGGGAPTASFDGDPGPGINAAKLQRMADDLGWVIVGGRICTLMPSWMAAGDASMDSSEGDGQPPAERCPIGEEKTIENLGRPFGNRDQSEFPPVVLADLEEQARRRQALR